jgi:O-antigen ligase
MDPRWESCPLLPRALAVVLCALAAGATLTIWMRDPLPERVYEGCACALGILTCLAPVRVSLEGLRGIVRRSTGRTGAYRHPVRSTGAPYLLAAPVALIGLWGAGQLIAGATVYRWATLDTSLRMIALAATGVTAWCVMGWTPLRRVFLRVWAGSGFLLGVVSVVAYFTSPSQVLWLFAAPYPDVWGPFLSRNNFAQFLELVLPVCLWWGLGARGQASAAGRNTYLGMAAAMLAAGLASASRAGAALLLLEAAAVFYLSHRNRRAGRNGQAGRNRSGTRSPPALVRFALAAALLAVVCGAGTLWTRLGQPDPLEYRREIYRSALAMIRAHAVTGTGLGTFPAVYPAYAGFDSGARVEHAHSDWLEWATEGGIPYAAVWGVLAVALMRPAMRSIWGVGVPAIFLHALVDDPFARLGVAAWVSILAGAAAREAEEGIRGD